MKYVRLLHNGQAVHGVLDGSNIRIIKGDLFENFVLTEEVLPFENHKLLSPCLPGKAICIGLNYYDHAKEMKLDLPKEPLIFMKPSSALCNPGEAIIYPSISNNLHYEAELAVVIGKTAKKVSAEMAKDYIFGYTCANDVTARDIQKADGQWTRGKSCDTFLPLGPCIETEVDPANIDIKLFINNELRQSSNTCNLIFKVDELIAYITQAMTLYPGDVILTGTPAGVGSMEVGDEVTVKLGNIGKLTNKVIRD